MAFVTRPQLGLSQWVDEGLYVLDDSTASPRVIPLWQMLVGVWVFLLGIGVIAWDYGALPGGQIPYIWFWLGIVLCFAGVLSIGMRAGINEWALLGSLAALAGALYLPIYLRSPSYLIFQDEVYHYQILRLLVESGHTQIPVTAFSLAGSYPGLELFGALIHWAAGISLLPTARITALILHVVMPLLVYGVFRLAHLGRRPAFLGALVFCANTSFFFFHSLFSYETQGVFLFILLIYCLIASEQRQGQSWVWLAVPVLVALTVTHHTSSIGAAVLLLVFTIIAALRASKYLVGYIGLTVLGLILPPLWFSTGARPAFAYLYGIVDSRVVSLLTALENFGSAHPRTLFLRSPLPQAERVFDFLYVPLALLLAIVGIVLLVRWHRNHGSPVLLLTLGLFGPVLWVLSLPLVFTRSQDLALRGWPFVFIGVGLFAGVALTWLGTIVDPQVRMNQTIGSAIEATVGPWRIMQVGLVAVLLLLVLEGGLSIGDNQAGRFPQSPPQQSAGPQALTPDTLAAAQWLVTSSGRYHQAVGDLTMDIALGGYGFQDMSAPAPWTPFLTADPALAQRYLSTYRIQYVAVDRRDSQDLGRYDYYFSQDELFIMGSNAYGASRPIPAAFLAKFDQMSGLERIYDNGNILFYQQVAPGF